MSSTDSIPEIMRQTRPRFPVSEAWSALGIAGSGQLESIASRLLNSSALPVRQLSAELGREEFLVATGSLSTPANLIGACRTWRACSAWSLDALATKLGGAPVTCSRSPDGTERKARFDDFVEYCRTQSHDSPLYIFDGDWEGPLADLKKDYEAPAWATPNLMNTLPEDTRPPQSWFLVGPQRSGSGVHLDPLGTCAWNALVKGTKLWVVWPRRVSAAAVERYDGHSYPDDVPGRVFMRIVADMEAGTCSAPQILSQEAGDILFVPGGCAHAVLNLSDTIAVTENQLLSADLRHAWPLIQSDRPELIPLLADHAPPAADTVVPAATAPASNSPTPPSSPDQAPPLIEQESLLRSCPVWTSPTGTTNVQSSLAIGSQEVLSCARNQRTRQVAVEVLQVVQERLATGRLQIQDCGQLDSTGIPAQVEDTGHVVAAWPEPAIGAFLELAVQETAKMAPRRSTATVDSAWIHLTHQKGWMGWHNHGARRLDGQQAGAAVVLYLATGGEREPHSGATAYWGGDEGAPLLISPADGLLTVCPSHVQHCVLPFLAGEGARIIVACNISFENRRVALGDIDAR